MLILLGLFFTSLIVTKHETSSTHLKELKKEVCQLWGNCSLRTTLIQTKKVQNSDLLYNLNSRDEISAWELWNFRQFCDNIWKTATYFSIGEAQNENHNYPSLKGKNIKFIIFAKANNRYLIQSNMDAKVSKRKRCYVQCTYMPYPSASKYTPKA